MRVFVCVWLSVCGGGLKYFTVQMVGLRIC